MNLKLSFFPSYLWCFLHLSSFVAAKSTPKNKIPAFTPPDFTFPQIDDFEDDCTLPDGAKGTCRNINHCPLVATGRSFVQTCYFEGFEQFVCCKLQQSENIIERPSTKACREAYPEHHAIVHGIDTKPHEFPYMAALGWETWTRDTYQYSCGGVLISPNYVLTAAHCGRLNGLLPEVVLLGGVNLTDSTEIPVKIEKVIIHPLYSPGLSYHDIALIKLKEPFRTFQPICIYENFALQETNLTAIGYGHVEFGGKPSPHLLKAYLLATTNSECQTYFRPEDALPLGIAESQICAKDPLNYRDTCQGDSGGPIISKIVDGPVERPYVIGITSFGQNCAGEAPGVYTRVSHYIDWIEDTVWPR